MSTASAIDLRQAILTSVLTEAPGELDPRFMYVPRTHVRALDPDNMLVVGARGTGKSFWRHALIGEATRAMLASQTPSLRRGELEVSTGWSEQISAAFPDKETLAKLRSAGHDPRTIWRAILARQLAPETSETFPGWSWALQVHWASADPENIAKLYDVYDRLLAAGNIRRLVLFDALDRVADRWEERRALLQGLLHLVLDLRSTRAIRAKVFVSGDMIEDPAVLAFPDASKVLATRVNLTWPRQELYGLLWQYMGNAPQGGESFRDLAPGWKSERGVHLMPEELRANDALQRRVFTEIAGEAMGANERRGRPFTWIPTHLSDAAGVTTPRSFLVALRVAAEETPPNAPLALDWRAIQSGVRQASDVRAQELTESFPWIRPAMEALRSLDFPSTRPDIIARWTAARLDTPQVDPPEHRFNQRAKLGLPGLLDDLVDAGALQVLSDGRYHAPPVYRVGFGLRLRGGVRPVR
jgi:hypothetical protein